MSARKVNMSTEEPIYVYPSEELRGALRNVSGRTIRVLFGLFEHLNENHVTTTQTELGKHVGMDRSGVSRAFKELRRVGLLCTVRNGLHTVPSHIFWRGQR